METIEQLTHDKVNIFLRSKLLGEFSEGDCLVDKWFGTKYKIEGEAFILENIKLLFLVSDKLVLYKVM